MVGIKVVSVDFVDAIGTIREACKIATEPTQLADEFTHSQDTQPTQSPNRKVPKQKSAAHTAPDKVVTEYRPIPAIYRAWAWWYLSIR